MSGVGYAGKPDMIGQTVLHYRILEKLGGGGMGVVYKAQDLTLNRAVALKFLPPELTRDSDAKERFVHEAQAASALDHPNICDIHDSGETSDGQSFIVMAYYEGETLKQKLERGPLAIEEAVEIAVQITRGLAAAHERGIVHRDIKPANVIITPQGMAKIVDFGLAKLAGRTMLTKTGSTLGTAAYMSPEQALGERVDQRTDLWSVGVVLYEMVAGRRPFESDYDQALVYSILNEEPPSVHAVRPEVPEALAQVVRKSMAKKSEERYHTAGELLADLEILKTGAESGKSTIAYRHARKKLITRIGVVAALALIGAAVLFVVLPMLQENALASNPKTISVISFENLTGDKNQDHLRNVLQDAIITSLEQSKYFRVTTRERAADLLKQMGKKDVEYVDRELGMEICRRDGAEILAVGTFASAGELYRTTVKLVDVNTLQTVKTFSAGGKGVESLLAEQIDDLSRDISEGFGISRRKTREMIRPIDDIGTTSPLAYQLYLRGMQEEGGFGWADTRHYFEMALKEDSLFVSAWIDLALVCAAHTDMRGAAHAQGKAVSLFEKASEKERLRIATFDTTFRPIVMGRPHPTTLEFFRYRTERFPKDKDFLWLLGIILYGNYNRVDEAIAVFNRIIELDPSYGMAYNNLGYVYKSRGDTEKAIEVLNRYAAVAPGQFNPYDSMGDVYLAAGRHEEAIVSYLRADSLKTGLYDPSRKIAKVYFRSEDYENAIRWNDSTIARKSWGAFGLTDRAYLLCWLGRLKEAESVLRRRNLVLKTQGQESDGFIEGWIEHDRGELKKCRTYVGRLMVSYRDETLRESPELLPAADLMEEFCLGYLDLREGKLDSVELRLGRMDSIRNALPVADSSWEGRTLAAVHESVGWRLRSELLLAEANPAAVPSLVPPHVARMAWPPLRFPYSRGGWGGEDANFAHIPPAGDGIARAYAAVGLTDSAITMYERGMSLEWQRDVVFPRYHYSLAKLYEQKGMRDKAIAEYERFLKIWGKADPAYKEPADARAKLAKLTVTRKTR